jgi:outer membrane lipoprotein-sorting protein
MNRISELSTLYPPPPDRLPLPRRQERDTLVRTGAEKTTEPTAEEIVTRLLQSSQEREARLSAYVVPTTYRVTTSNGKVRAEAEVQLRYSPPSTKEFQVLSETGSSLVRDRVFKPLMDVEVESAAGRYRERSAISPVNYTFSLAGEERVDDLRCFVLQVEPKRIDKYLFRGKIWVDTKAYAIVRIVGELAKSPSFWISRVDFVRSYRRVGTHWLPSRNESITKVRISGRNILTIDYGAYHFPNS